jgi:hypothetical protein
MTMVVPVPVAVAEEQATWIAAVLSSADALTAAVTNGSPLSWRVYCIPGTVTDLAMLPDTGALVAVGRRLSAAAGSGQSRKNGGASRLGFGLGHCAIEGPEMIRARTRAVQSLAITARAPSRRRRDGPGALAWSSRQNRTVAGRSAEKVPAPPADLPIGGIGLAEPAHIDVVAHIARRPHAGGSPASQVFIRWAVKRGS